MFSAKCTYDKQYITLLAGLFMFGQPTILFAAKDAPLGVLYHLGYGGFHLSS